MGRFIRYAFPLGLGSFAELLDALNSDEASDPVTPFTADC